MLIDLRAPLVAGERVFVVGVDRAVHAFDAIDGRRLWTLARPGDALTLSQPGVLAAYKDTLVVGQGALLTGVGWTAINAVALPRLAIAAGLLFVRGRAAPAAAG